MNLDRFTQKAQEAIVAAQALAERLQSPVLDAEHILAALVERRRGDPGRDAPPLGADLAAFRGELAALLARRAKIPGGQLALDSARPPRAGAGRGGGAPPGRRVRLDGAPAARRRRRRAATARRSSSATGRVARRSSARSPASAAASGSRAPTPRAPTRRWRSTAAT